MEIFKYNIIEKPCFIITSLTFGLKRPVHRGFGCER